MPLRRLWLVTSAAMVIGACGGGATQREFTNADALRIRALTQDFEAAFNAKDLDKIMNFYAGSAVFMPPNSGTLRGKESIRGFYESTLAGGTTDLSMDTKDIGGHGPLAYESGTFTMMTRPPNGGAEDRDRGKYLFVLRNMAGQWRYEYTIWSSDLPPRPSSTGE